jgi:hypothetical protein
LLRLRQKSVVAVTDLQQEDEPEMNGARAARPRGELADFGARWASIIILLYLFNVI